MSWVFFAVFARAIWAGNNVVDKHLISRHIQNPVSYLFIVTSIQLLVLVIIPFHNLSVPPLNILLAAFFSGALFMYGLLPYFQSLTFEEASRSVSIWQITPIFVLIISSLTVGEQFDTNDWMAFVLLFTGGILISTRKIESKFHLSKAFFLMLGSCVIFAIQTVLSKYVYLNIVYLDGFMLSRIGAFLGVLPILFFSSQRTAIVKSIVSVGNKVKIIILINTLIAISALASYEYAISKSSVTLVNALGGIQTVFLLLYATILSLWFPSIVKEELRKSVLILKVLAISLIIAGVYLVSI